MIVRIAFELDDKQVKALRVYRKFLNRTRGTSYETLQELLDDLTKKYLNSLANQMQQVHREKVAKAYRFAPQVKQDKIDADLGVIDDE